MKPNIYVFELSDNILEKLIEIFPQGYTVDELSEILCTDRQSVNNAFAVLISRKYANVSDKILRITNDGGDFILSGGFCEQMKREKLSTASIEASISAAKATEKITSVQQMTNKWTLIVAIITCVALVVQIIITIIKE